MKKVLLSFFSLLLFQISFGQTSPSPDAAQIQSELEKLDVLGSVLYIAAHPDDENTRLLAYLANEKHYRTGYLSLTRGDGGQNLIGDEQGEQLGLIRTQELLAARRVDGAEQFFTRAYDFGYTKNPEETFQFWDKEKILSDVVFVIRKFQPDIIIMRFPTTGEGGHGHHTASAILAVEAFTAAADPNRFPEQLQYVKPWQAKRLLWNTFNFGGTNTTSEDQFKLDVGLYNPLLGKSYGEIAAESRSNHKSQGFGIAKSRGSQIEYFKTISGDAPQHDLMDGVTTSWSRIQGTESIQALLDKIISGYEPNNPSASVPGLVNLYFSVKNLPDGYWKSQKLDEIKKLIAECAGLWFEAYSDERTYCAGENLGWKFQAINRSDIPVTLAAVSLNGFDSTFNFQLANNQLMNYKHQQNIGKDISITQPYWLLQPHSAGMFVSAKQNEVGDAENVPPLEVKFIFKIGGVNFDFDRPLVYKTVDPAKGEIYDPLVIAPPVTANLSSNVLGFSNTNSKQIKVMLNDFLPQANGTVKLIAKSDWKISPSQINFSFHHKGDDTTVVFNITPPSQFNEPMIDTIQAEINVNGETWNQSLVNISYDHIPSITYFPPAQARIFTVPVKFGGMNIGYIKGAGDKIPGVLENMGYKVTMLDEATISNTNIQSFDAIVVGVRAYNIDDWLKRSQPHLLDYVKNGGTLVVQYNTAGDLVTDKVGPYPFKLSRDRVTDENAKVNFINPKDPILNSPNKISDKDFEGWIQERGLYFVSNVDSNYRKIFTMNDKGENPLDGSLIVTNYGKGKYVYTSLAFFRELPAGVPGAVRLFVNLISKND